MSNSLATALAAMLESLWRWFIGATAGASIIGTVTWADVLVAATFLALALLGTIVTALVVRRCASASIDDTRARDSLRHVARALGKPLHVLIWASGLYFAATPFTALADPHGRVGSIQALSGLIFDLALFFIVFWLALRLTRVLDDRLMVWAANSANRMDDFILPLIGRSLRIAVPVSGVILALPLLHLPARFDSVTGKITSILLIASLASILLQGCAHWSAVHPGRPGRPGCGQSACPKNPHPGRDHLEGDRRRYRAVGRRVDPDALRGSAPFRRESPRFGRDRGNHTRDGCAEDDRKPARRLPDRARPTDTRR
jgi:hypothetical protein